MPSISSPRAHRIPFFDSFWRSVAVLLAAIALSSCGGGGGSTDSAAASQPSGSTPATGAQETPAALSPEATAVDRLNKERLTCGFGTTTVNPLLNQAALNHAEYNAWQAASLGVISLHLEILGQPLFTGVDLFARAAHVGYPTAEIWESVSSFYWPRTTSSARLQSLQAHADEQMRSLLSMVYHTKGVLVNTTEIGTSVIERVINGNLTRQVVVELGTQTGSPAPRQTTLKTYPCQGTTAARAVFIPSNETPNPAPGFSGQMGTPIYLRVPPGRSISISNPVVRNVQTGQAVATDIMTLREDPHQQLAIEDGFILPRTPLTAGSSYRITADVVSGQSTYRVDFTFTPS